MRVLLYGINFFPELTGIGKYTGEMAFWLAKHHDVKVVTAPPYYPEWKVNKDYSNKYAYSKINGVDVHRAPLFVPESPNTWKRLIHLCSFAFFSFFILIRLLFWRPHIVFMVEPTLFCAPGAWLYARLTGAKLVLHIQDFEIDAMFGLGLMSGGALVKIAQNTERFMMRKFDAVSTISMKMLENAKNKGVEEDKLILFPNWVDTDFVSPYVNKNHFRDQWNIPHNKKIILYSGNMGKKQGLEIVLDAANHYKNRDDILFIMVGQGAARQFLEDMAQKLSLKNLLFKPLQPYEDLPKLLALPTIHLVIQKKGAADVVLPSKVTGILSVGGYSVITAEAETELGLLVKKYPNIAVLSEPESLTDLINAIDSILVQDNIEYNKVAREYAEKNLNRDAVLQDFQKKLHDIVANG